MQQQQPGVASVRGVPSFKDQVRSVQPQQQQPGVASVRGVRVPSVNEEPSTVIAHVVETIDDGDDNNPMVQPQQSGGNSNPTTDNGYRKHLIWAGAVVVLGLVVAVVVGDSADVEWQQWRWRTITIAPVAQVMPVDQQTGSVSTHE